MIDQAIALGDLNKRTLGFLPHKAYEQAAAAGTLLAVVDRGQVMAYALYSLPRQVVRLTHLCVGTEGRGRGFARLLIDAISERHEDRFGITLKCRNDFTANAMWPHLGFEKQGERPGRGRQRYPRAPSQRELAQLGQASNFATRKHKEGALDLAQSHADWADKLARTLGVPLAEVAPSVWHASPGRATTEPRGAQDPETVPEDLVLSRAAQQAVALAQQEKSTWTRADLVKYLGRVLPRTGRNPAQATALLDDLADRALRSEFEEVLCLEAPEPAEVPGSLLRADGRSVYRRHGGVRYATRAQLSMEDRMTAQRRAPRRA